MFGNYVKIECGLVKLVVIFFLMTSNLFCIIRVQRNDGIKIKKNIEE